MNLCTDQLAMLLAAPGQLISVSVLARDPLSSAMAEDAKHYPTNHGLAEEIFLMRPDLVLAEPYTRPATVALLRQLGIRVELIEPANSLPEVRRALQDIGEVLHRQAEAKAAIAAFDADLAVYSAAPQRSARAALYHANGYTTGARTLGGDILAAAGLLNVTEELGLDWGGILPLEQLVLASPDLIVSGQSYPGASRAEDVLRHPALAKLRGRSASATAVDADWLCGTPFVLRAVSQMDTLRRSLE